MREGERRKRKKNNSIEMNIIFRGNKLRWECCTMIGKRAFHTFSIDNFAVFFSLLPNLFLLLTFYCTIKNHFSNTVHVRFRVEWTHFNISICTPSSRSRCENKHIMIYSRCIDFGSMMTHRLSQRMNMNIKGNHINRQSWLFCNAGNYCAVSEYKTFHQVLKCGRFSARSQST